MAEASNGHPPQRSSQTGSSGSLWNLRTSEAAIPPAVGMEGSEPGGSGAGEAVGGVAGAGGSGGVGGVPLKSASFSKIFAATSSVGLEEQVYETNGAAQAGVGDVVEPPGAGAEPAWGPSGRAGGAGGGGPIRTFGFDEVADAADELGLSESVGFAMNLDGYTEGAEADLEGIYNPELPSDADSAESLGEDDLGLSESIGYAALAEDASGGASPADGSEGRSVAGVLGVKGLAAGEAGPGATAAGGLVPAPRMDPAELAGSGRAGSGAGSKAGSKAGSGGGNGSLAGGVSNVARGQDRSSSQVGMAGKGPQMTSPRQPVIAEPPPAPFVTAVSQQRGGGGRGGAGGGGPVQRPMSRLEQAWAAMKPLESQAGAGGESGGTGITTEAAGPRASAPRVEPAARGAVGGGGAASGAVVGPGGGAGTAGVVGGGGGRPQVAAERSAGAVGRRLERAAGGPAAVDAGAGAGAGSVRGVGKWQPVQGAGRSVGTGVGAEPGGSRREADGAAVSMAKAAAVRRSEAVVEPVDDGMEGVAVLEQKTLRERVLTLESQIYQLQIWAYSATALAVVLISVLYLAR